MTIVLKLKNEKGYFKIFENVTEVKEIDDAITFKISDNKGEWTLYKSVLKNEIERIVM